MPHMNEHPLPVGRAEIIGLLKRVAWNLKESKPDQQLATFQNEIACSYGYQNWSMLRKHARTMTQSEFASFAERIRQDVDAQGILLARLKFIETRVIKCALFSKNIGYIAHEFRDGEAQAIVLSDSNKVKAALESNDVYYYNVAKVEMHKRWLNNRFFEVPLVAPRGEYLHWIEGFHQVTAAIEEGMKVVPIGTSLALAEKLKSLVGLSGSGTVRHPYDFSECEAAVV